MPAKSILLVLFLATFALSTLQQERSYNHDFGYEMLRVASVSGCPEDMLRNMTCGAVCKDLPGYSLHHQYTAVHNVQESFSYTMLVNPSAQKFVVSFRGTRGVSQLMQQFLHSKAVSYLLHEVPNAVVTEYFYSNYIQFIRENFLNLFKDAVNAYPGFQFYIVGHSLGGAFASLAVIDIHKHNLLDKKDVALYTYGCPRVGDSNLAKTISNSVGEIFRITHHRDIVPHLPPCITDFKGGCTAKEDHGNQHGSLVFNAYHAGTEIFYDGNDGKNFKVCKGPEDPNCSNKYSLFLGSTDDHRNYMGASTRCLATAF